jgi:CrcB protein
MARRALVGLVVPGWAAVTALLVTVAGGLGVLARHLLASAVQGPWTIVAINVAGSFLLGLLVAAAWASPQARTVAGVGFLGGFTTFSAFSMQVVSDLESGRAAHALVYVFASVMLGILAAAAGFWLAGGVQR